MHAFGRLYAKYYDLLYQDKDYDEECDFIENVFSKFTPLRVKSLIDISCGTGGHAIILAKRGYNITAIDFSEHMVRIAKRKAAGLNIDIRVGDMTRFDPNIEYDCCISMFDSINYLQHYEDLGKTFENVRRMLRRNGLFIFQYWNGPAVLTIKPSLRKKVVRKGRLTIIRYTEPTLMSMEQVVLVSYHIVVLDGDRLVDEFQEEHKVRFFYPLEVKHFLNAAGFELVKLCPAFDLSRDATENDWSTVAITRAI